jgi:3-phosphoshikimate 1-carboxyvinyltransferase
VHRLRHKESDRADVLQNEMAKIGITIKIEGHDMLIAGGKVRGGTICSHNDHRIAMAGAVLGLISEAGISIEGAEAINKSYPGFFDDLNRLTNKGIKN